MKANELMIGDVVSVVPSEQPIHISAIHNGKVGYHAVTHKLEWVRIGLLRPIPLTPEILEKNFRPGSKYNSFDPDYIIPGMPDSFGLELRNGVLYITDHVLMPIRYVHELQHALRMCGLDKLADNFKI